MRRKIHLTALAVAGIGFTAQAICGLYAKVTHNESFSGFERIFGRTATCAAVIALVTQHWAITPAMRQTIRRIIAVQIVTGILAGLGILVVIIAGPGTAIGRVAIYVTLAIGALGAGFGMAYGYSLPWVGADKRGGPTNRNLADARETP